MSGLLGLGGSNASTPTELSGYRVQTSILGTGITIVGGTARVAGNVVWLGNWQASAVNSGGKLGSKGSGGGKGSGQFTYTASFIIAVSQGPCVQTLGIYQDKSQITQENLLPNAFGGGGRGATPWGYLAPGGGQPWSGQAIGYSEIAIECFENQSLGTGGNISNYSFELAGNQLFGGYVTSVGSSVLNFATGSNRLQNGMQVGLILGPGGVAPTGLGGATLGALTGAVAPYYVINATSSSIQLSLTPSGSPISFSGGTTPIFCGWLDSLTSDWLYFCLTGFNMANYPASSVGDMTEIETYCIATGNAISPVIDSQDTLNSYMTEYLLVCNSEAFSSEGVIKFRTYGDAAVTGNGVTFTPNLTPEFDLDYDDFIVDGPNNNPVTFTREAAQDATNQMSFEWTNRGRQYNLETVTDQDQNSVDLYGLTIGSAQTIHSVCQGEVAQQVLSVQLKRSVNILRKAQFTVGWSKSILEPMDLVTVPEQYPATGTVAVRVLTIDEDEKGNFAIEGECLEYLGLLVPAIHQKQIGGGYTPGYGANPSLTNAPMFLELPPQMSNAITPTHLILAIFLSGGVGWGGCGVYLSIDGGNTYQFLGQQTTPSQMGFLTQPYPYGADPDEINLLSVNLQPSFGEVPDSSQATADAFKTLTVIDQEIIAFGYSALTGVNEYSFDGSSAGYWMASTAYALNAIIIDPAGHLQKVTTAGTSGATAPSWNDSGGVTGPDGSVYWTDQGLATIYNRRGVFGSDETAHALGAPFAISDGTQFQVEYSPATVPSRRPGGGVLPGISPKVGDTIWFKFVSFNQAGQQVQDLADATAYPYTLTAPYVRPPIQWKPYLIETAADPYYRPGFKSMALTNTAQQVQVYGVLPPNQFSPSAVAPVIDSVATITPVTSPPFNNTPGTYVIAVFAIDSNGLWSYGSNFAGFTITSGASRCTVAVTLLGPSVPDGTAFGVAWGTDLDALTFTAGVTASNVITLQTGTFNLGKGPTPPDPRWDALYMRAKPTIHAGIFVATISAVTSSTITIGIPVGGTLASLAGLTLTNLTQQSRGGAVSTNLFNAPVTSNTGAGVITLPINPTTAGWQVGDLVMPRMLADTFSATTIGCSLLKNCFYPSGLVAHVERGYIVRIIGGTGAGQWQYVEDNTDGSGSNVYTLVSPWATTPDATSIFIVEPATWGFTGSTNNYDSNAYIGAGASGLVVTSPPTSVGQFDLTPVAGNVVLVEVLAQDPTGNLGTESLDCIGDIYIPALPQPNQSVGYVVPIVSGTPNTATPDLSQGPLQIVDVNQDGLTILPPVNYPLAADYEWTLIERQTTGNQGCVLDPSYNSNYSLATSASPSGTQCTQSFVTHSSGNSAPTAAPSVDQPIP